MALFRPYEQKSGEQPKADEAARGNGRRRGRSGASAAPRPAEAAAPAPSEPAAVTEPAPAEPAAPSRSTRGPQKKGAPTPTRAQAQAARMERLHPTLSPKEARRAQREANRASQQANLRAIDASPARTLMRDHVDAHYSLLEFTMPIFFVMIIVLFAFAPRNLAVQNALNLVMTVVLLLMVANAWFMWHGFKRLARARGVDPKQRGLMMYGVNRMMQLRPLRNPKPRIKRGESY